MKDLIYKDSRGAKEADEHFTSTGHKIVEEGRKTVTGNKEEFVKHYKCQDCSFVSMAGEINHLTLI